MKYKIEKAIPIPPYVDPQAEEWAVLDTLEVGDSVYFEYDFIVGYHEGKRFERRREGEGLRVWRTS